LILVTAVFDAIAEYLSGFLDGLGIVSPHGGSGSQQAFDDGDGRGLAHVVGTGLEGGSPTGDGTSGERLFLVRGAKGLAQLVGQDLFLAFIDIFHSLEQGAVVAALLSGLYQSLDVLGKAG